MKTETIMEQLKNREAGIAELTKKLFEARAERDKALESRREWMEKATEARQEIARLKACLRKEGSK